MNFATRLVPSARLAAGTIAIALASASAFAVTPANAHKAPLVAARGTDMGRISGETPLKLTVWMNLHNKAELNARVKGLYTAGSPTYHQWLSKDKLQAYMPSAADIAAVKQELAAYHVNVVNVDPGNFYIRIEGKSSDIESAFQTQLHSTELKNIPGTHGKTQQIHTTTTFPRLRGEAGLLVHHLGGVDAARPVPHLVRALNPRTGKEFAGKPYVKGTPAGLYYSSQCFYDPATLSISGVSATDGTTPAYASYSGLTYGADPTNTDQGTLSPCGYSPQQVYGFYGLDSAYADGVSGSGQTIAIVDAYQEPAAVEDLALFSAQYGLPAQTKTNFTVYSPDGVGENGSGSDWASESDLDLEWSHAIAPKANIAFVQAFSDDIENLQHAVYYAVENHVGDIISGSFGLPEGYEGPFVTGNWDAIAELGASEGINLDFSSGDDGDFTADGIPADVSTPASSQYATAIGGTSIGTDPGTGNVYTVGWGNNFDVIDEGTDGTNDYIVDALAPGFYAGSGGGSSAYIAKPGYQAPLSGTGRQIPDVSALADPYTGAEYIYDDGAGNQYVGVIGGTSLAAPIFSGMWALANEVYGSDLGQAAPIVAQLQGSIIRDVVPLSTPYNVTGSVTENSATTTYTADQIILASGSSDPIYASAIWNLGDDQYAVLSFGTDSGLATTKGWDNVTGYGTPDVSSYFSSIAAIAKPAK